MTKFLIGPHVFAIGLLAALASPAQALCVSERDIVSTTPSKDGKKLLLKMRDGRTLVNNLKGVCSDLRFNGFIWVLRGSNDICENMQTLKVIQSGQICLLGKFEPASLAPVKAP